MAKTRQGDANRAARAVSPAAVRRRDRARQQRLALCAAGAHVWIDAGLREWICSYCNAYREQPQREALPSWLDLPHGWYADAPPPARWVEVAVGRLAEER
jgi:hypothetical protein